MATVCKLGVIMEKVFTADEIQKQKIQKKYIKSNKGATVLSIGLLMVFLLFSIVFAVYGFGSPNTFLIKDVTASDYGQKNFLLVWIILITVDIIILFLWFVQKLVINGIFGKFIRQRINESLIISEGGIEYGYQNLVGSTSSDRVIVRIPVDSIRKIKIDQKIAKIELDGLVSSKYYENYSLKKTRAPKNNYKEGTFVLFDYFEPSLMEFFKKNYAEKVEME